ncbi:hypothetical protein LTS17_003397 [Exophiala oligosperma]
MPFKDVTDDEQSSPTPHASEEMVATPDDVEQPVIDADELPTSTDQPAPPPEEASQEAASAAKQAPGTKSKKTISRYMKLPEEIFGRRKELAIVPDLTDGHEFMTIISSEERTSGPETISSERCAIQYNS